MSKDAGKHAARRKSSASQRWPDERLVKECLNDNEEAWNALVEKYKNLVYSVPLKYGLSTEDAADVFQSVFLELLEKLPAIRAPKALPMWLIQVTSHKCLRLKQHQQRAVPDELEEMESQSRQFNAAVLEEFENEHRLREAVSSLAPRCRELIEMLFFEEPSRPYAKIAKSLGIATGSISFIRARCLQRLRAALAKLGFK